MKLHLQTFPPALALLATLCAPLAHAQQAPSPPLETPRAAQNPGALTYSEYRVGGRIENVIVTHKNGWREIFHNNRDDTLWGAGEKQLGDAKNIGRWILRSW